MRELLMPVQRQVQEYFPAKIIRSYLKKENLSK